MFLSERRRVQTSNGVAYSANYKLRATESSPFAQWLIGFVLVENGQFACGNEHIIALCPHGFASLL
jgi:hypothetical protein